MRGSYDRRLLVGALAILEADRGPQVLRVSGGNVDRCTKELAAV
jgi:hypothetical protein